MNASTIPGITGGQPYTVTLVFDNGGTSTANQAWVGAHLQCTIWTFNTGGTVVFTQNLVATPVTVNVGSVITNGAGVLTSNFSLLAGQNINSNYTVTGTTLVNNVTWIANGANNFFFDSSAARSVGDASGGVQMAAAGWSNPVTFNGNCAGLVLVGVVAPVTPQSIPTLSGWAMLLVSGLLGAAGLAALRRRG